MTPTVFSQSSTQWKAGLAVCTKFIFLGRGGGWGLKKKPKNYMQNKPSLYTVFLLEQCKCLEFSTHSLNTSQNNVHIVNECKELRRIVNVVWLTITLEKCVEREKLIFYILHNWTASEPVFSSCTSLCAAAFILELVPMGMGRMGYLPTHVEIYIKLSHIQKM